jgi:glycosyltransferase involved in cell wall biosynthesis
MRICLLHYAAQPVVGGVESVMGHHARLMANAGHQVLVLAGRGEQEDPRIHFERLPLADSRNEEVLRLKRELDAGRVPEDFDALVMRIEADLLRALAAVDLLIAHNVCSLNKNLALTAALKRVADHAPVRLILWHHDLAWTTPRYRPELHDGYPWDLLRTDWAKAVQVVVSEARRAELAALLHVGLERIRVIPNGVDPARFLKLGSRTQDLIQQRELFAAAPLLLLPVRITPRKNIELALSVLAELRSRFPQAALVVTGPLGAHNAANVEYLEWLRVRRGELGLEAAAHFLAEISDQTLSDDEIADFYRLADVLFLPSREEGFGIPILEAGLAGIPVFCSDIPPLRELGSRDATYFSPDGDPKKIADQLGTWLAASPVFALGKRIRSDYAWSRIYQRQIAPLLELS